MKRIFALALLVGAFTCGLHAQVVTTDVCAILKNPKSFDGKIVSIKGTVVAGFDEFIVKDPTACGFQVDGIWLSYPAGTKGKAGPVAVLQVQPAHNFAGTYTAPTRAAVTLDKGSKDFKQFDSLLAQTHNKGAGMCLGCVANTVTATLVGRLDAVENATLARDKDGKIIGFGGFGNMNAYPARLVLQSVSEVTPKEVDFSKSDEITKGAGPNIGGPQDMYDPIDGALKSIARLAGSPAGTMAEKDVAAFGKHGEHNGVSILYTATNEANPRDEAPGAKDSPDGILFNCIFNLNRIPGDAQVRTVIHMGQHVVDLRTPTPGNEDAPLYIQEYNAWSMTAADAVSVSQNFLTLPGGYLLWNLKWAPEERNTMMDAAIKSYLADYAALSR
jgi:hypothetical protein